MSIRHFLTHIVSIRHFLTLLVIVKRGRVVLDRCNGVRADREHLRRLAMCDGRAVCVLFDTPADVAAQRGGGTSGISILWREEEGVGVAYLTRDALIPLQHLDFWQTSNACRNFGGS